MAGLLQIFVLDPLRFFECQKHDRFVHIVPGRERFFNLRGQNQRLDAMPAHHFDAARGAGGQNIACEAC